MASYIIKDGDTLTSIAKATGSTIEDIASYNGIEDPNMIRAGTTLLIPSTGGGKTDKNKGTTSNGGTSSSGGGTNKNNTAAEGFSYDDFSYGDYKESDTVTQAQAALNAQLAARPGAYQSKWQAQIDDIINRIMNREEFSYDVNGDALYQQYKDKYIQQGKMAMQDTMGQAAAMTGGYGNSYAATVGNQAYQAQLNELNDVVPELYQMALDRYMQEGNEMYQQYALLGDQENLDYGKYRDQVAEWQAERDYLTDRYDSERSYDYGKYTDERDFAYGEYSDDKNYAYNEYRNTIADEKWQKEYDESVRQYNEEMAFQKQQYKDSKAAAASSGGGSTGGGSSGGSSSGDSSGDGYNNENVAESAIKQIQEALGVTADGKWGAESKAAAGGLGALEAYKAWKAGKLGDNAQNTSSGFTGKSYSEAVAYLEKNGVSGASGIMTQTEWARRKSSYQMSGTGSTEVVNYDSYQEYLADIVEYKMENASNSSRGGRGNGY